MKPRLVLLAGYALALWLLRTDMKWRKPSSRALWIPALWLAVIASRPLGFWIGVGGSSNLEGNPIHVLCNGLLIASALVVLHRRSFNWRMFTQRNMALALLYTYFAFSSLWSEFPLPTLKRLVNDFLCVLAALVMLTEPKPGEAMRTVFVRVSYLLLPMSVVTIRFFPAIGRAFSKAGVPMYTGVAGHKNSLGELAMVTGLVLLWDLMATRKVEAGRVMKIGKWSRAGVLLTGLYLLAICQSATSLVCFVVGAAILILARPLERMQSAGRLVAAFLVAVTLTVAVNNAFDVSDTILTALDRNPTLTGRTTIWRATRGKDVNPLIGYGFRGFWETEKGQSIYEELDINRLLTAHNGYLETYLNGGIVAVALLAMVLIAMGQNAARALLAGGSLARMPLVFWVVALIYNASESSFFITSPLWFTLLVVTIDSHGLCDND